MKTTVFQPFEKVWTPRTPDSNYDSLGPLPSQPIVNAPLVAEGIGTGITISIAAYLTVIAKAHAAEGVGCGIALLLATYAPVSDVLTPLLTGLSPSTGPHLADQPGQKQEPPPFTLTINGSNFEVGCSIYFDGTLEGTTMVSSTQLTCLISHSQTPTAGTYPVYVTNPNLRSSNTLNYIAT